MRIGHIARTGGPIRIRNLSENNRWVMHPDWAQREGLRGFAGRPLIFRGEVLGVIAVFRFVQTEDQCWSWISAPADAASVDVANARAFEEAERLRCEFEMEGD